MPQLNNLVKEIESFTVIPKQKYFEYEVIFGNLTYSIGSGGLHAVLDNVYIKPEENEYYSSVDVASYYPSQIIDLGYTHRFLGQRFIKHYSDIRKERFEAKAKGDKAVDKSLKLTLVSLYGQYLNEYSPYYDGFLAQRICVNGQLMLLMLAEKMHLAGFKVVSANTDSVDVIYPKNKVKEFQDICNWWQKKTKMILEEDRVEFAVFQDVNCYFMKMNNGYVKEKGRWLTTPQLGKGFNKPIINIALREYFMNGIKPEETILNHKDPLDFCSAQRVGKKFQVIWQDKMQQRINRYYVSLKDDADYIYKRKEDSLHNLLKGHKVSILNDTSKVNHIEELKIDYEYYINETYKTIKNYGEI